MSDKKNIDRLFQEKFKDFEANPAEDLWGNIEARLEDKKRKRVIPFWWKFSGLVAVLFVGILITKTVFNDDVTPTNAIVNEENSNQNNGSPDTTDLKKEVDKGVDNTSEAITDKEETNNNSLKLDNTVDAVAPNSNKQKPIGKIKSSPILNDSKSAVAHGKSIQNQSSKSKSYSESSKPLVTKNEFVKNEAQIAESQKNSIQDIVENPIAQTENNTNISKDASAIVAPKELNLDGLKGDNNTKIAVNEVENKVSDTTINKSVADNPLEELLNEKEKKSKQESKQNRWQLTSNVAPIFLGSLSGGSPIDSTLVNNSKTYNTRVGFGLGVNYAVNSKLTIRTGLNKLNMSYNTNEVFYYASMQTRYLNGLSPTGAGYTLQVESAVPNPSATLLTSENELLAFEEAIVHKNEGYINQEIGYLEMPLEMSYAIIEKRFGLKIISGFSTLFLQDNSISIVSNNRTTVLGRANNLNPVHFSTNIGLGIKYGFMKSFEFNVEPTFKYQLNTFRSNDGNFKPYVFGIYSGISYRF
ncbi:hypothetical protein IVB69_08490 [Flavobacterium sp. J49]|uniref:hypothetical protein n=1 Tax=Flavobacterium sp. J49 TaxID=2718534 RepID=UPI001594621F|nr:hypothetical protein [Flavobacterium sp. J49]MBF6641516.1 hypothetical protein [Flavobacterium sp. J49]NIC02763.1 hypothetical protein [Flavobacterium sp. J49]